MAEPLRQAAATNVIDVASIEVIYNHVILVLKGVSLAVPEGSIVALLGANGAGKSTTLKALMGMLAKRSGTIRFLGRDVSKEQQSSDWGQETLSDAQLAYAAADVVHLHALKDKLDAMLAREGRLAIAQACFEFLPARAALDLMGWEDVDVFAHG